MGKFDFANWPWIDRAGTDSENILLMLLLGTIMFVNIV
jgi:hypothetical protein